MKKCRLFIFSLCVVWACCGVVSAATYSANGAGALGNSSLIGVAGGEDYPTIAAAAADFNSVTSGMAGDYTFFINSDITETTNSGFGRNTNGFTLTYRPSLGKVVSVLNICKADNNGPSGGLVFGHTDPASGALDVTTPTVMKVVIDGTNTPGSITRDILFTYAKDFATEFPPGTAGGGYPRGINVWGDCTFVFKNFNLNLPVDNALITAIRSIYGILITSRRNAALGTDDIPNNWVIENCRVDAVGARQAHAIGASNSGTITAGKAQTNWTIRNCFVTGQTRGILLNQNSTGTLEQNTLRCTQLDSAGGLVSAPFIHASSNGVEGWTIKIDRNRLDQTETSATVAGGGIAGLQLSGAPGSGTGTTYTVTNNFISGFKFTHDIPVPGDYVYNGIVSASSRSKMEIYHNSINMPNIPDVLGTTARYIAGICDTSTNALADFIVKNNIIRFDAGGTNAAIYAKNSTSLPVIDYNIIYQGAVVPFYAFGFNATNYANLATGQAAGFDVNGKAKDPFVADPPAAGVWTTWTNLHFTSDPGVNYTGTPTLLTVVPYDFDGTARTRPVSGAHEETRPASVIDWAVF